MKGLPWKKNHQELKDLGASLIPLFAIPVVWGKFLYRQSYSRSKWIQTLQSKATQYTDTKGEKNQLTALCKTAEVMQ